MPYALTFQELVELLVSKTAGLDLDFSGARLLRHDAQGRKFWSLGRSCFEHWASFQGAKPSRSPYNNCSIAFHFVPIALPGGVFGARFVCAHHVGDRWIYEGPNQGRQPRTVSQDFMRLHYEEPAGIAAYDLHPLPQLDDLSGKVDIHWSDTSHGTRAWSQWWKRPKPIVELRREVREPPFPGFADFRTTLNAVDTLPETWQHVLKSVGGVYMLVCPETGQQYVGSATSSEGGFMSRWAEYAADSESQGWEGLWLNVARPGAPPARRPKLGTTISARGRSLSA